MKYNDLIMAHTDGALSKRAINNLRSTYSHQFYGHYQEAIETIPIDWILTQTPSDLFRYRNFGMNSIMEIRIFLQSQGLDLTLEKCSRCNREMCIGNYHRKYRSKSP